MHQFTHYRTHIDRFFPEMDWVTVADVLQDMNLWNSEKVIVIDLFLIFFYRYLHTRSLKSVSRINLYIRVILLFNAIFNPHLINFTYQWSYTQSTCLKYILFALIQNHNFYFKKVYQSAQSLQSGSENCSSSGLKVYSQKFESVIFRNVRHKIGSHLLFSEFHLQIAWKQKKESLPTKSSLAMLQALP